MFSLTASPFACSVNWLLMPCVFNMYLYEAVRLPWLKFGGNSNDASCDVVSTPNQELLCFCFVIFPSAVKVLFLDEGREVGYFLYYD